MSKQCGNCKWWDDLSSTPTKYGVCRSPLPNSIRINERRPMTITEGQDCPVFEERKE